MSIVVLLQLHIDTSYLDTPALRVMVDIRQSVECIKAVESSRLIYYYLELCIFLQGDITKHDESLL